MRASFFVCTRVIGLGEGISNTNNIAVPNPLRTRANKQGFAIGVGAAAYMLWPSISQVG